MTTTTRPTWGGRASVALLDLVLDTYGWTCHLCLLPITGPRGTRTGPSSDHVTPRSKGGTNELTNLRPAHRSCNSRRGARALTPALLASFRAHRRPESGGSFFQR